MDNLNKLLKYLINSDEMTKIADSAKVSVEVVQNACMDIFRELIPTDFTRNETGSIEKKDLAAITSNFNNLLSGNNLRNLVSDFASKNSIESAKAGVVVKEILVIVRDKLKYMTAVKKEAVKEPVKEPVKQSVQESVKQEVKEEVKQEKVENVTPSKEVNKVHSLNTQESTEESADGEYEEELGSKEKIVLYIIAGLLLAVIIVIGVILFKTLRG